MELNGEIEVEEQMVVVEELGHEEVGVEVVQSDEGAAMQM